MMVARDGDQARDTIGASDRDLGDILHEARNPLAACLMAVRLAADLPDSARISYVRDHLEVASSAAGRVFELIEVAERMIERRVE